MSIRQKFFTILGILMLSVILLSLGSEFILRRSVDTSWELLNEHYLPMVDEGIPHLNQVHASMNHLLEADRDAYRAMMSLQKAARAKDREALNAAIQENKGYVDAILININKAIEQLPQDHLIEFDDFYNRYEAWTELNYTVSRLSDTIWDDYTISRQQFDELKTLFEQTRSQINELEDSIELRFDRRSYTALADLISEDELRECLLQEGGMEDCEMTFVRFRELINELADSMQERMVARGEMDYTLGKAVAFVLNADRDAYQVVYAELAARNATSIPEVFDYREESMSNLNQMMERLAEAKPLFSDEELACYDQIVAMHAQWSDLNTTLFDRLEYLVEDLSAREEYLWLAGQSFELLRQFIDDAVVSFQQLVDSHMEEFAVQGRVLREDTARLEEKTESYMRWFYFGAGISILLLATAFLIQRRLVRHLSALSRYFETAGVDQLQQPFVFPGRSPHHRYNDELENLQRNLNRMRMRLNEAILGQRREEETRMLYERIIESAQEPMLFLDRNYIYRAVNSEVVRRHGTHREDLIGKRVEDVFGSYQFDNFFKPKLEECLCGKIVTYEGWVEYASGSAWMYMRFYPYYEEDGSISGIIYVGSDLTDLKRAEEARKESERRYSSLFNNPYIPMLVVDLQSMSILDSNQAASKFYGYTQEELLALDYRYISQRPPEDIIESVHKAYRNEQDVARSIHRLKDGSLHDVEISIVPVVLGNKHCFYAIIQDISERKRWEQAILEARDLAESANKAKDEFLAVMSHELRTPLNPIIGFSSMLLEEADSPELKEFLTVIRQSSEHLLSIIDNILKFSKLTRSGIVGRMEAFNLLDLLSEAYRKAQEHSGHNEVLFENGIADVAASIEKEATFFGVPGELCAILDHLLDNAIRFTDKGRVVFRAGVNPGEGDFSTAFFEVEDNGIGIPEDKLQRIFDPFVQADSSMTRDFGGIGLGLAICRKLVDIMGGIIDVQSKVGQGAVFRITIPLEKALPQDIRKPVEQLDSSSIKSFNALLVEDNEDNRTFIGELLAHLGGHVDMAKNGMEALDLASGKVYDIVFMDLNLPVLNGVECTVKLRKTYSKEALPIIGFTAFEVEMLRAMEDASLFNELLEKPLMMPQVRRCVQRYLAEK
ncbi:MAG: PAS domain S-box protein [Opitutales bacterium]|nr:PAS domain S-box protein [Opitutales bacterium]